jgi:hypothetical protein
MNEHGFVAERHRSPRGGKTNDVPNRLIAAGVHRIVPRPLLIDDGKGLCSLCQMFLRWRTRQSSAPSSMSIVRTIEHLFRLPN